MNLAFKSVGSRLWALWAMTALTVLPSGLAIAEEYGSWHVDTASDFASASTKNESGSEFGIICGKQCLNFVDFQTACTPKDKYPGMMNSEAGALSIELTCYKIEDSYALLFSDDISDAIKGGKEIGFAIPLKSGKFSVSRFSLAGAASAVVRAVKLADQLQSRGQNGAKDFTL